MLELRKGELVRVEAGDNRARMHESKDGSMKCQLEAVAWNGGVARVCWQRRGQAPSREAAEDFFDIPAEG